MGVDGKRHALAAFPLENGPGTSFTEVGWAPWPVLCNYDPSL